MSLISSIEKVTEATWYKVMMPKLYGWGASLVIIGALFKIEHWQYDPKKQNKFILEE